MLNCTHFLEIVPISLIFQNLFSGKSTFLINQFTFWNFRNVKKWKFLKSQLCFSFWYANINIPNDAAWGGWWGFVTEHIADFSDFFWNPIISCMIYQKFISDFSEQNFWNTINCIFALVTTNWWLVTCFHQLLVMNTCFGRIYLNQVCFQPCHAAARCQLSSICIHKIIGRVHIFYKEVISNL